MKNVFLGLLILAFVIPASALEMTEKGVKAGLNFSNIYGDDAENNNALMGFAIGGYAVFQYNDNITLHPELYYTGKGFHWDYSMFGYSEEWDTKFSYLEIPVLCGYHFQPDNKWDPTLLLGPYLGFLLSAENDGEDVKDDLKSMDFGLGIGFSVKGDKFTFNLRDSWGLGSIDNDNEDGYIADIKNTNMQLIVGYSF